MKIIAIIQARMGSTRLPGKVLLPLGSSVVLDYVVSRCQTIKSVVEVIVATSSSEQDDEIYEWCLERNVPCYRGSEEDVLSRYYECARSFSTNYVMRVTADCPFVDIDLANATVEAMLRNSSDIVVLKGELPRGLAVELVSFAALEKMYVDGQEPRHREHVTYYAYEFPQYFSSTELQVPTNKQYPRLRITLDTEEDYQLCQKIANQFPDNLLVPSQQVIEFLLQHPAIAAINAHIEQKPVL
ncbi:NTP transferase domain-containing protein [Paenibacillus sp. MSJ-34]|uniref:cytidylyltransferase domain-containing protein n=1 Tax=Paenibacillus sp. MSJ-34 TaxID=2841529 RepID=UPI001C1126D2|nr:glycosyltransferase family protein [Paenibacillus sp. MSJ-34]MBU5441009.1 glycosyltransferase family protein [Paenibacillus sp. MSJ-34]